MKRILVPTDFSPTAEKAFRFALDLAKKANGTVILYHTYVQVESIFGATEKTRKQTNTQRELNITKRLQRLSIKVSIDKPGVAVSTVVGRSPLIDNIIGFAEHNHIDIIVLGTQGASGINKTIVGSVAVRIIEKTKVPVLLIPAKHELEELRQFVFTTNYQPADKKALTMIEAMAKLYHADITVLHFLNAYTAESDKVEKRNDFDAYAFYLQREFNESRMRFHLLETPSVTETMETLDKKFPYDMVAMVRRKKTFLEKFFIKSFTKKMAYVTKKPLLVIPEEE